MAAIGLERRANKIGMVLLVVLACLPMPGKADDSADVHQCVSAVALALSSGDSAQAMISFSKTYPDYATLSNYFEALSGAYSMESQVDFTEEELSSQFVTISVRWALTLTTRQGDFSKNRTADLALKLAREGDHWRITAMSPLNFFDPQKE